MLKPPSLTVGIEEEYLLVDPATRNLVTDPNQGLWDEAYAAIGDRVTPEFLRAQMEVGTRPQSTIQDLAEDLTRVIITAADPNRPAAGEFDLPVPDRQGRVSGELPDLIADYGLDPADVTVTYEVDGVAANLPNNLPDLDGVYRRGMNLTVTVAVTAPAVPIPFIADAAALTITAEHTERIDQHRSITRPGP